MNAPARRKLNLACEIVWALDVGIAVMLVLTILRAAAIAPGVTEWLLRLGWYLLPRANEDRVVADTMFILIGAVAYGFLALVAIHVWLNRGGRTARQRAERRRGFRVTLISPVFVYGWAKDEPFAENTETVNVSEFGGLIPISSKVIESQEVILTNLRTDKNVACRVARLTTRANGQRYAGLVFPEGCSDFWEVEFVSGAAADPTLETGTTEAHLGAR